MARFFHMLAFRPLADVLGSNDSGVMKILWLFAHPDQRSLNAHLRDEGIRELSALGHEYRQSDLYAMEWKAAVDADDFNHDSAEPFRVGSASKRAYMSGKLSDDIRAEQDKLRWAETVILQFPLWWYGMPAILKGWFDRVFVRGFAYDVVENGRTLRYGEGGLSGKRAMVVVSAGAREATFAPRGINGEINDLLFPLQHGTLWYTGMDVVPPLLVPAADRFSAEQFEQAAKELRERLRTLPTTTPLPFRRQNSGDYDKDLVLRPEIAPGRTGNGVHRTG
jgi:NAD(P)H dehydrogenase (quinone)